MQQLLIQNDFIIKNNVKLSEVIKHIQEEKCIQNSVILYKNVLNSNERNINIPTFVKDSHPTQVVSYKFKIVTEGIRKVISNYETVNEEILKSLNKHFPCDFKIKNDQASGINFFNKYVLSTVDPNFSSIHLEYLSPKKQTHLHFNKSLLLHTEPLPGINAPMWRVSYHESIMPFQDHSRNMSYVNLLLQGDSIVYLFVPYAFINKLTDKLQKYSSNGCKFELFHNLGCMLNINLLLKWKIPVKFFIQEPGDLVFINRGVFFCAINIGINLSETIHFYLDTRRFQTFLIDCKCENEESNRINTILMRLEKDNEGRKSKKICIDDHFSKPFKCKNKKCSKRFTCKHDAKRHFEVHHKKNFKMKRKYSNEILLKRREKIFCQICDKYISRKNCRRHLSVKHKMNGDTLDINVQKHLKNCYETIMVVDAYESKHNFETVSIFLHIPCF